MHDDFTPVVSQTVKEHIGLAHFDNQSEWKFMIYDTIKGCDKINASCPYASAVFRRCSSLFWCVLTVKYHHKAPESWHVLLFISSSFQNVYWVCNWDENNSDTILAEYKAKADHCSLWLKLKSMKNLCPKKTTYQSVWQPLVTSCRFPNLEMLLSAIINRKRLPEFHLDLRLAFGFVIIFWTDEGFSRLGLNLGGSSSLMQIGQDLVFLQVQSYLIWLDQGQLRPAHFGCCILSEKWSFTVLAFPMSFEQRFSFLFLKRCSELCTWAVPKSS